MRQFLCAKIGAFRLITSFCLLTLSQTEVKLLSGCVDVAFRQL